MAESYVKFLRGTPTAYEALAVKDSDTLYFISAADSTTGKLYLGDKLISGTADDSTVDLFLSKLNDVSFPNELKDNDLLKYDVISQKWTSVSLETLLSTSATVGNLQALLDSKVDKVSSAEGEEWTLLSPTDKQKLDLLVVSDEGIVEISGKVNAANVEGLADWITANRNTVPGLYPVNAANLLTELESKVTSLDSTYLKIEDFNSTVGSLEELLLKEKTLSEEIAAIGTNLTSLEEQFQWKSLEE